MIRALIIVLAFGLSCDAWASDKRYAKSTDGVDINQPFVVLEDGSVYATHDKKVIGAETVRTPKEATEIHNRAFIQRTRERYWESGAPPEKGALERYLERKEKGKKQRAMQKVLADENWVKEDRLHSPKEEGG